MITIQYAGEEAIEDIRNIVNEAWPLAYGNILEPAQLKYMLHLIYDPTALKRQMRVLEHQFLLARNGNASIGFASYAPHPDSHSIFHLHKIYVLSGYQGKHIGKLLLDHVILEVKNKGASALHLNVNRYNKARHFYEKQGFQILSEEDIDIGEGYFMNDYVMGKSI